MANMSIGALTVSAERNELYHITFPYFHGSLIFAIPYTSLEKLVFPFYNGCMVLFDFSIWIGHTDNNMNEIS